MEALAATPQTNRIQALDIARGFALLGIFLVNIDFFALPFAEVGDPGRAVPEGDLERTLFWLIRTLCEQRFYPLFSLLFGMGLVLQRQSIEERGGEFAPLYLRRTGLLILIGATHGLLFWYGDILFTYGFVALLLLALSGLKGQHLAWLSVGSLVLSIVVLVPLQVLQLLLPPDDHAGEVRVLVEGGEVSVVATQDAGLQSSAGPFDQLVKGLRAEEIPLLGERWSELETLAYQQGGLSQSFGFRSVTFLLVTLSSLLGGVLTILTMFLLGAAMVKLGFLGEREALLHKLLPFLLVLGVPFSVAAALIYHHGQGLWGLAFGLVMTIVAGPVMALLYFSFWQWCSHLAWSGVRLMNSGLAAAGRMALSNYLAQTVVASFVMYHWGLAMFGETTLLFRVVLVVVFWLCQVIASVFWLSYFRFGPLEWLWRSATYLEVQPLRR